MLKCFFTIFGEILINIFGDFFSEGKKWKIFTKFCENFGESPNLVKNPVLIMSQNFVKLNVVILFSQNLVKF